MEEIRMARMSKEEQARREGMAYALRFARELKRSAFGFEIDKNFYTRAKNEMLVYEDDNQMNIFDLI